MSADLPGDAAERVRRALLLQLHAALQLLDAARAPADADVHEARKAIKRARALARLLRLALPERAFRDANAMLRDAGRALSRARDQKVLRDTLAAVVARDHVSAGRARRLRARLGTPPPGEGGRSMLPPREAAAARARLTRVHDRIARVTLADDAAGRLAAGLARIHRRGRRAMAAARATPTPEALHEWRKQVQNYWHALEALPTRGTPGVRERIAQARSLSRLLGDDHDLAMLERRLESSRSARSRDAALQDSIARRRARRQRRAFAVGRELYGRHPP